MTLRVGTGDYQSERVDNWPMISGDWVCSDVVVDSKGNAYVAARTWPQARGGAILVFAKNGRFLSSWGEEFLAIPHGLWIDAEDRIYHADATDHTVRVFSVSGEQLVLYGTPDVAGLPGEPYNRPCRAKVSPAGDMYVADGYGQNRVHRISLDGEVVTSWGRGDPVYSNGVGLVDDGPGGFNLPHDVSVDEDDLVYVSDRENHRIQIFDNMGTYITEWGNMGLPCDTFIDGSGIMHVAGGSPAGIRLRSLKGKEVGRWTNDEYPGLFAGGPHGLWVDDEGSVYIGEIGKTLVSKFARV